METIHSARIRSLFDIFIPLNGPTNLEAVPLLGMNFGFALGEKNNNENCLHYHIQLILKHPSDGHDVALPNCFVWAKRNAIRFQRSDETQEVEGILAKIKLPTKLFDFRKHRSHQARIQVTEIRNGQLIKQAFSNVVQILPKSRTAHTDTTALIPIFWAQDIIGSPISPISPLEISSFVAESPADEIDEIDDMLPGHYSNLDTEPQYLSNNTNQNNENYMVLYNGNAEVVGNFRALNFYKSSDINIKEDIRLLTEDRDCRDTLLQIDGVNYKFKKGVHPDTNRRFVGYIAQQVESVVPEAVQLIDGILHVDYESLIPYLSESVRANYGDIKDLKSKAERIQQTIDEMYDQFIRKTESYKHSSSSPISRRGSRKKKVVLLSVILATVLVAVISALAFTGIIPLFGSFGGLLEDPKTSTPDGTPTFVPESPTSNNPATKNPPVVSTAWKDFYTATNGDTWLRHDNWLNEKVLICDWYGVFCTYSTDLMNGTSVLYIRIDLDSNNLTGTLPSSLYKIDRLQRLELQNNSLTGTIPEEFTKMEYLDILRLSNNNLTGTLPNLSKYPTLTEIDLSSNQISGTIPTDFLSNWKSAKYLNLANNRFNGIFSLTADQFGQMKYLNISNNQFDTWQDDYSGVPEHWITCDASNNPFKCPLGSVYINNLCGANCN